MTSATVIRPKRKKETKMQNEKIDTDTIEEIKAAKDAIGDDAYMGSYDQGEGLTKIILWTSEEASEDDLGANSDASWIVTHETSRELSTYLDD